MRATPLLKMSLLQGTLVAGSIGLNPGSVGVGFNYAPIYDPPPAPAQYHQRNPGASNATASYDSGRNMFLEGMEGQTLFVITGLEMPQLNVQGGDVSVQASQQKLILILVAIGTLFALLRK